METYHVETTVQQDGTVTLTNLPFQAGDTVEVVLFVRPTHSGGSSRYPLRGTPIRYIDPTEPVADADWEMEDELRPEYDMTELLKDGVRGKYAKQYREGTNLVLLAPDVAEVFTDAESVNQALRLAIQIAEIPTLDAQKRGSES